MLNLHKKVISNGYCIGCGICALNNNSPYQIITDNKGCYQARIKKNDFKKKDDNFESKVCPFFNSELNEDTLAKALFSFNNKYHVQVGYYNNIFIGQVSEDDYYLNGSSGGAAKWLLTKLLEKDLVDYIVQVYNNEGNSDKLFEYRIVSNKEEIKNGSKSAYYPVEISEVLKIIKSNPGRYSIIGVPCFIKGIRLLQKRDQTINERIKYCFGIFCGHLKSKFYAEMIAWQKGVLPEKLCYIDFRTKIKGKKANEKGVIVKSLDGYISEPDIVQNIFGTNYGYGFFKYSACDFCDDVIAETADISFGDAWLPEYLGSGTSIIVSRNEQLSDIIIEGINLHSLNMEKSSPEVVFKSQEAAFRHRRDGLAVRLRDKQRKGIWTPPKRYSSINNNKQRIKIYKYRSRLSSKSFRIFLIAKTKKKFDIFKSRMSREIDNYNLLYRPQTNKQKLINVLTHLRLLKSAIILKRAILGRANNNRLN